MVIIKQRFDRVMDGLEEYDEEIARRMKEEEDFDNFEEEYEKR